MAERDPRTKRQGEVYQEQVQRTFLGMKKDLPASEIQEGYSARNINCNDYGTYAEGRAGSRVFSQTTRPTGTLNGRLDHVKSGYVIKIYGSDVWLCDKMMQSYIPVLNISGVSISGKCTIKAFNENALIFSPNGTLYMVVLNDVFPYVRRMNVPQPTQIVTDINEGFDPVGPISFGYRYIYSLLQKSGNDAVAWDRTTEGFPPVFESATTKPSVTTGKDYGECFYEYAAGDPLGSLGQISGVYTVPDDVHDVTHFGIYRTKNIGQNTTPPGVDPVRGIGNNPELYVWCRDIPVAKAFYAARSTPGNNIEVVSTQGQFTINDVGCTLKFLDGAVVRIIYFYNARRVAVEWISGTPFVAAGQPCAIGGGRMLTAYQSGLTIFKTSGDNFVPADVGTPVFWMNGKISWISEYVAPYKVRTTYSQDINNVAATIRPLTGNFSRSFRDDVWDDGTGHALIGLTQRFSPAGSDPLYVPKRFWEPIPSGDIGLIDFGFLYTTLRDATEWYYSDYADKPFLCGYYRPDRQREKVDSPIRQIDTIGSLVTIFMKGKTRVLNPAVASDTGTADVGEKLFVIPPSYEADSCIGVMVWQSIIHKGAGIVFAVTSEPAVRTFDGKQWSEINYASDQVQKDLQLMDVAQKIVAVYTPGKYGGYKIWFQKWVKA
jgi:hypothetical protein